MQDAFNVLIKWDADAQLWYIDDSNVPGLVAEASSVDGMLEKLRILIPELLELNGHLVDFDRGGDLPIHLMAQQNLRIQPRC